MDAFEKEMILYRLPHAERKALERKCRRKIVMAEKRVQTWRATVTLECGHVRSFTMSAKFVREHETTWKRRQIECTDCAREIASGKHA